VASGGDLPPDAPPLPPVIPLRTFTLGPGDTPAVVSMIYGLPISALRQANPRLNFNRLRPGDTIIIPPTDPGVFGAP